PVEAAFALRQMMDSIGGRTECRLDGAKLPAGNRAAYVGTARVEDIDGAAMIQLIGTNPREEMPVLNARIRKAWLAGAQIGLVGAGADLTYDYAHVGTDRAALESLSSRKISDETREKPSIVIVGQGAIRGADGEAVLAHAMRLCENSNSKLLILHTAAARVGAMDVGAVTEGGLPAALDGADVVYALGADELDIPAGPNVIYPGSHGDRGAHRADGILPAAAWVEENGLVVNTEGRPQLALRAAFPPGEAKENWAILRALSARLGETLPYDSLAVLRQALVKAVPHLKKVDQVPENEWNPVEAGSLGEGDFSPAVTEHYLPNPVTRASALMGELAANARARRAPKLAAE
ncbi:MAG: molybdopterin-dependent oxidoreductase, partial [Qingshengfaniella sp.]